MPGVTRLFTLVGIAGEDDLDAPDIATPDWSETGAGKSERLPFKKVNGSVPANRHPTGDQGTQGREARAANPALATDLSATLCQQLFAQINDLAFKR